MSPKARSLRVSHFPVLVGHPGRRVNPSGGLDIHRTIETQKKWIHTAISQMGFQPKIPKFEKYKAVHGYDRADLRPATSSSVDNNSCVYVIQEVSENISAVVCLA
jgi:hypothetical protein